MDPLISIVIPVYNAEKTLTRCLESVRSQRYPHLEVLLVNDGSTDGSGALCAQWARRDSRFRYFEQPNAGVAQARNTGLSHASGAFLAFLDADDFLDEAFCETLLRTLLREGSDLCIGQNDEWRQSRRPDGSVAETVVPPPARRHPVQTLPAAKYDFSREHTTVWGALYKKACWRGCASGRTSLWARTPIFWPRPFRRPKPSPLWTGRSTTILWRWNPPPTGPSAKKR